MQILRFEFMQILRFEFTQILRIDISFKKKKINFLSRKITRKNVTVYFVNKFKVGKDEINTKISHICYSKQA